MAARKTTLVARAQFVAETVWRVPSSSSRALVTPPTIRSSRATRRCSSLPTRTALRPLDVGGSGRRLDEIAGVYRSRFPAAGTVPPGSFRPRPRTLTGGLAPIPPPVHVVVLSQDREPAAKSSLSRSSPSRRTGPVRARSRRWRPATRSTAATSPPPRRTPCSRSWRCCPRRLQDDLARARPSFATGLGWCPSLSSCLRPGVVALGEVPTNRRGQGTAGGEAEPRDLPSDAGIAMA